ncbi:DUF6461 domain-containing protein [Embleya sp. NPDC056575]|uniref:DUF6461 domain-containing protein n=1 Tax=unclassified Embleya TaxID=2699296 RepID=UPI0036B6F5CE
MRDGIVWLVDIKGWMSSVVFARGITPHELALRMGGDLGRADEPMTDTEAWHIDMEIWRPGEDGDGVVRVGECAGWSFAIEYGHSTGSERQIEISRGGVEAVHYVPIQEHPPATVSYTRDGVGLWLFGLGEEDNRYGAEPDLLLPDLAAAGVLDPTGEEQLAPEDEDFRVTYRRTLGVIERRFGLSLGRTYLEDARLPVYAVRGTPHL